MLLDPVIRHPRRPLQLDTEDKYFTLETESKKNSFIEVTQTLPQ